jgi:hypothetical protein
VRQAGIEKARTALNARLQGEFCPLINMPSTSFAAGSGRILPDCKEARILVMLHDFVDSPHGYRSMLFPDFNEWIYFLLERAEKTPYRWFVKPHPCLGDPSRRKLNEANRRILADIKKRFVKIDFLDENISNRQLIEDGVSAIFTVHGSAGHEFAYSGIPVVNAGDNPHIAYDFNIHAKTIWEYEELIQNAGRLQIEIDREKIEEFFYMHHYYFTDKYAFHANPINTEHFRTPASVAAMSQSSIFNKFCSENTPERERDVHAYLMDYFDRLSPLQISSDL